ncbi:heparinase II/III domain-containing protein [Opitutus terrae]|uniref:Heparinase II/III family protein n=1 Tax=Opitutus terrae (strain DSM 11246 / JCM 15787 / PB90-1) TaxID=452637 RepID=B1ZXC4_OPITP|nr:heparinase II/III family protein [Opitutus terrae]ACB76175.1 Heparinase II/III family protein [Opitutus terrae PB90-1]
MNTSRRTFLKTSATLAATLPFARLAPAATSPVPSTAIADPRRGLLFDQSELPRIRANLELPRLAEIRATLLNVDIATETRFLREELRLNNHVVDFIRAWKIVQNSSFAHVVWGDAQHLELALLGLTRLCDYKRWDYFLEAGRDTIGLQRAPEATIATCYALDWLGSAVPAELRRRVEDKILTEGAPACYRTLYGLKYPDRVRGWGFDPEDDFQFRFDLSRWPLILNPTNLKVIPTCGLGIAALWFYGRHPDAKKWLQLSRQSAQAFATMYGLDGAYDEGVGYWGYTTTHLAMLAEALYRRLGVDERRLINYPGTIRYALSLAMPCGGSTVADPKLKTGYNATPKGNYDPALDVVNFSDAGVGMDVSVAPWVGEVAKDPLSNYVAQQVGALKQFQAAVWYRPEAPTQPPGAELLDVRLSNDWIVSRTGWAPADSVVALRSGGPANHEHADRNSVIFKAHGERLFSDPFKAGYSPKVPRWLLRQTEAHTALLIDGHGHQYHDGHEGTNSSWATASVVDYRTGPDWMTATSDATEAYALVLPEVVLVTRTLVFLKPDILLLLDRVSLRRARPVQLRYQVFNDDGHGSAVTSDDSFQIRRPLAQLEAQLTGLQPLALRTDRLALPPEETPQPFVEASSPAATDHLILTAATAAPTGGVHPVLKIERAADAWRVTGQQGKQQVNVAFEIPPQGIPRVIV